MTTVDREQVRRDDGRVTLYYHVPKDALKRRSARVADPPYEAFDVVLRRDYDALVAELEQAERRVRTEQGLREDADRERDKAQDRWAQAERERDEALVALYRVDAVECANFCDERLDRTGALLGRVRAKWEQAQGETP